MLDAFRSGGDFHSRTAVGMYDYIRKEVEAGTKPSHYRLSQLSPLFSNALNSSSTFSYFLPHVTLSSPLPPTLFVVELFKPPFSTIMSEHHFAL